MGQRLIRTKQIFLLIIAKQTEKQGLFRGTANPYCPIDTAIHLQNFRFLFNKADNSSLRQVRNKLYKSDMSYWREQP